MVELLERASALELTPGNKGGSAAIRRCLQQAQDYFGTGWISSQVQGRTAIALGSTVVDDRLEATERYALSLVLHNTRSNNVQEIPLVTFSEHAVARAMQRTGHVEPTKALAVACSKVDLKTVITSLASASDGDEVEIQTATGCLHCVVKPSTLVCKTFIDTPGQGSAPLKGEV